MRGDSNATALGYQKLPSRTLSQNVVAVSCHSMKDIISESDAKILQRTCMSSAFNILNSSPHSQSGCAGTFNLG